MTTVVVMCGRRWGKTTLGGVALIAFALAGAECAWVAPSFPQSRTLWRWMLRVLEGKHYTRVSKVDRRIEIQGGGSITIYSAEAETTIRGSAFDFVVVDEAAYIPEQVWEATLIPTLADRRGRAMIIGTPKGRNWFWREWMRGKQNEPGYHAYQASTRDNPNPNIQAAYQRAKELLPARIFAQEWDAIPVDDAGGVFIGARQCARSVERKGEVVLGVDLGRDEDYTAVAVFDTHQQAFLQVERWRGTPYTYTAERVENIARKHDPVAIVVETNAMGAAVADLLEARGLPVSRHTTTRASKQQIIERLAAAIEREEVTLPPDDYVLTEFEAFTARRRADGGYDYSAPAGLHDDCVMACAIAYAHGQRTDKIVEVM
ncbi:MAG: terminase family protein [Anaerolineae bacterium]|nr:terminase family protein [Anaerolineae bacterium]